MASVKLRSFLHRLSRMKLRIIVTLLLGSLIAAVLSYIFTARNTLVISDGGSTTLVGSYGGDLEAALLDAGIELGELDSYTLSPDGIPVLKISRAKAVTVLMDDGSVISLLTDALTVSDILSQLGIQLTEFDSMDCSAEDEITDGMRINIAFGDTEYYYTREEVAFDTLYVESASLAEGQQYVLQAGVNGLDFLAYRRVTREGEVISDTLTETRVIKEPLAEIVVIGAAGPGELSSLSNLSGIGDSRSSFAAGSSVPLSDTPAVVSDDGSRIITAAGDMLPYTRKVSVSATAYTTQLDPVPNNTASGTVARVGAIAVDSSVIPLGSRLYIVGSDGTWIYGYAIAEDRGGGIQGNRIDLFFDTNEECVNFGVHDADVYILG